MRPWARQIGLLQAKLNAYLSGSISTSGPEYDKGMSEQISVEFLEEHDYLVRVHHSAGMVESRFRASPDVLAQLGLAAADQQRTVEESARYLLDRQPAIDLPPMVDLDDMAAAFDDYATSLQKRMNLGD
jgi:hypothetical protein